MPALQLIWWQHRRLSKLLAKSQPLYLHFSKQIPKSILEKFIQCNWYIDIMFCTVISANFAVPDIRKPGPYRATPIELDTGKAHSASPSPLEDLT